MLLKAVRFKTHKSDDNGKNNNNNKSDSFQSTPIILPDKYNLPNKELQIQQFWHKENIYLSRLKEQNFSKRFSIYEAPAFAFAAPNLQDMFNQIVKDVIARYYQQIGFYVERNFILNSHGLAIEYESEQKFKFPAKTDKIEFAKECQSVAGQSEWMWRKSLQKMGKWWDIDSDLSSSNNQSLETVWFVFKTLMQKGLIEKLNKIMPFSIACRAPISTFEAQMNLKEISRPKIVLKLKLDSANFLLVCTTNPWTLTGNIGVCVNPNAKYLRIKSISTEEKFIIAENRVKFYFNSSEYELLNELPGHLLQGWKYEPVFNYFNFSEDVFQVIADKFVSTDCGTGIVHLSPFLSDRDLKICVDNKLVSHDKIELLNLIDDEGKFLLEDFSGKNVFDSEDLIIEKLQEKFMIFQRSTTKRVYPHCWVSDTPLISKFCSGWFLKLDLIKNDLKTNLESINWGSERAKNRMTYWINKLSEWNLSRSKFWGIPIPIWSSADGKETVCIGSLKELQEISGINPNQMDIDEILIASIDSNGAPLKRVDEVFDCWFESGCFSFESIFSKKLANISNNKSDFLNECVVENEEQVNKWLLSVFLIGTALNNRLPFKTVLFTGKILAGNKKSNADLDFLSLVGKYGADSLRFYFLNSCAVENKPLELCEKDIQNTMKQIKSWYGSLKFLIETIAGYQKESRQDFVFKQLPKCFNLMDIWLVSVTNSLIKFIHNEIRNHFKLNCLTVEIFKLIDFVKIYIRLNWNRLKRNDDSSLEILFYVQWNLVKILSPFAPFTTEYFYQLLRIYIVSNNTNRKKDSVHLCRLPSASFNHINYRLERAFLNLQTAVQLVEEIRQQFKIPNNFRLAEAVILAKKTEVLDDIKRLIAYLSEAINVENVVTSTNFLRYDVYLKNNNQSNRSKIIGGEKVQVEEIHFGFNKTEFENRHWAIKSKHDIVLILNLNITNFNSGVANEVVAIILHLLKKHRLNFDQKFKIYASGSDGILSALEKSKLFIKRKVKMPILIQNSLEPDLIAEALIVKTETIYNNELHIFLVEDK